MSFFFGGGFQAVFLLFFFCILGIFVVTIARGIGQWNKNNHSPRLTVDATVVAKRTDVTSHHHGAMQTGHFASATTYYVTFEVESGDRMELSMPGEAFGMLAEGDRGKLSFQGTRFLGFERAGGGAPV